MGDSWLIIVAGAAPWAWGGEVDPWWPMDATVMRVPCGGSVLARPVRVTPGGASS